jgi:hypothetical protein
MKHVVSIDIDWDLRQFTLIVDDQEVVTLAVKPEIPDTLEGLDVVPKPECDCESCEDENLYDIDGKSSSDVLATIEEMRYREFLRFMERYRGKYRPRF